MVFDQLTEGGQFAPESIDAAAKWLTAHQAAITTSAALLALFRPWALFEYARGLRKNAPRIEFGLEHVGELVGDTVCIVLKLANVGGSVASDVRLTWNRRSSCAMRPVAQPFMLLIGEHRLLEFSARPSDLITRRMEGPERRMLGWLVVTYSEGGWQRRRVGRALVIPKHEAIGAQSLLDLTRLPRESLRDTVPFLGTIADKRVEEQRAREFHEWLENSKTYLAARGIPVEAVHEGDDRFRRLLGELGSRGWAWSYASGGRGYEVQAKKTWPPWTSMTIRYDAPTLEDAAALVLAHAMQVDEEQASGTI